MTEPPERAPRKNIFLAASIVAGALKADVRIRNMSEGGAMIEGSALPSTGCPLVLKRAEIEIGGVVVWSHAGRCGIRFDGLAYVDEWIAGKKLPEKANFSSGQRRVDAIQSALRSGQSPDTFNAPRDAALRPDTRSHRNQLVRRIGEEIAAVHRLLNAVADDLSDDPLMLTRHSARLQGIQSASEILDHLARVLQAADPEAETDAIKIQALRSRLLGNALF